MCPQIEQILWLLSRGSGGFWGDLGAGIVAGAGTACAIAGIPTTVSSCKKMNAIVNRYNETHAPEASLPAVTLNFGRTANGVGFTLNF